MRIKAGQLVSRPPCWKLECLCCVFHLVKSDRVWNHRLVSPYLTSCRLTRRQGFKKAQPFNQELLCRFVRFCTGNDVVLPYTKIKVQVVNMSSTSMRPRAQMYFNILTLPKNYRALARLTENIYFYMCNPHLWELINWEHIILIALLEP